MQRQDGCSKFLMSVRPWLSWIHHHPNYWSLITVKMFEGLEAESSYHGLLSNPNNRDPISYFRLKACISHLFITYV
jgi:hypothetical protein